MPDPQQPSTDLAPQGAEQLAEHLSEELGQFIGTIFGSASIEVDQILGNEVGYFRLKRALRIADKTRSLLEKHGLKPHQVPHRTAVPLLEAASLEDDDGLQDRWASLLANAAAKTADVPPSFAAVLQQLDPLAAKVLNAVYERLMAIAVDIQFAFSVTTAVRDELDISQDAWEFHVDNLVRLGVLRAPLQPKDRYSRLSLTSFGRSFVRACRPPGTPDPPVRWTDADALRAHIQQSGER